jgi:hypothetical protein
LDSRYPYSKDGRGARNLTETIAELLECNKPSMGDKVIEFPKVSTICVFPSQIKSAEELFNCAKLKFK